ncbi:MAG: hypothetical protein H6742_04670 [Alphaproteobacteria bacterium]|nr:hypothetical protein [Alphaproteobacteria bacterium]
MRPLPFMAALFVPALAFVACGDKDGADSGDGDAAGLVTESLGSFETDTGGLTGDIALSLPEGTKSALLHCGSYGYSNLGTAWDLRKPDGSYFYTNEFHESYAATKMRVGNLDDYLPVYFPVSPDHDITTGDWLADVWIATGGSPTTVDCGLVARVDSVSDAPVVDIHAVFVGTSDLGLTADSAPDDADFQSALDFADSLWADAGMSIGEVTYSDFSGSADRFAVVDVSDDDFSELGDLFKTTSGGSSRALTVFFVQEIADASGSTILGIAAGPPGAATVTGTSKSGMAVTTVDLRDDPREVGLILAHEGSHFMGLFHTSEKAGDRHDPLSDTPECGASANTDGNGYLDREECAGKGADNVMFWAPAVDTSDVMTADQGWVIARNPVAK